MEFHGSYGGQWFKDKSNPTQKKKVRNKRKEGLKGENESELQHFAV